MTRKRRGLRAPCMRGPRTREKTKREGGGAGRKRKRGLAVGVLSGGWVYATCFGNAWRSDSNTRIHGERWLSFAENGV